MEENIDTFINHFKNEFNNLINSSDPYKKEKNLNNNDLNICNSNKSIVVDTMEILSFSLLLHLYSGFYIFLYNQHIIGMIIYQFFSYILLQSLFDYNFFSFVFHPFFRNHNKDIVLPQILYTLFNYYILTSKYNSYYILFLNLLIYSFSNKYFENIEQNESKKVRTFMNLITYLIKLTYIKIIYTLFN